MDPNDFVTNDLLIDIAGAKFIQRIWIDFIYIKSDPLENTARYAGTNGGLVEDLTQALSKNIRVSQCLPVVENHNEQYKLNGNTETYRYRLVDGHNRISALKQLGYTGYWFDVAEFGHDGVSYESSKSDFAMASNAAIPKVESNDLDYQTQAINLVLKNEINSDMDSVRTWIKKYVNDGSRATSIAQKVLKQVASDDAFMEWTEDRIWEELPNLVDLDGKGQYTNQGTFDSSRKMFGWTTKMNYEHEYVTSCISKLYDTKEQGGVPSYFIAHTKSPTKKKSVFDHRDTIEDRYSAWIKKLDYLFEWKKKHGRYPFQLYGFLPQIKSERKTNKIIPVKKKKKLFDD